MHARRAILESIKTELKKLTGIGGVWIQRLPPTRIAYPCITLYAETENTETLLIHPRPRVQDRVITVAVVVWMQGSVIDEKIESDMDAAAVKIEQAMSSDFGADDVRLFATDFSIGENDGDLHTLTLSYQIKYITRESNPEI